MRDYHHSWIDHTIDVFEHPWILIWIQSQIVPSHTRVLRARVLAVTLAPEDVILHTSHIFDIHSRFDEFLCSRLCLMKNGERTLLLQSWFAQHESPANLS